jgi:TonB family protein
MPKVIVCFRSRYALALLFACLLGPGLRAQSTEADIKARLMGKPLYLKGFWGGDKLHFDASEQLIGASSVVSFTVAGFDLTRVQLKRDKLMLEGRRIGLELANDKPIRVPLHDESIRIEVDCNPGGDYGKALDAILVDGLADLTPLLPLYWSGYAHRVFLQEAQPPRPVQPQNIPADARAKRVGGGVKAPILLSAPEPQFSPAARALKYSGRCRVELWVRTDGTVSHLSVVRATGLGLDEHALAVVQQYKFKPAMEDDKPVTVELEVEVNFQIF